MPGDRSLLQQQAALGSDVGLGPRRRPPAAEQCCDIAAEASLSLIDKALGWKGDRRNPVRRPSRYRARQG